jgi:hypothetical protein
MRQRNFEKTWTGGLLLFRILDFLIATFGKVVYNKALELSFAL